MKGMNDMALFGKKNKQVAPAPVAAQAPASTTPQSDQSEIAVVIAAAIVMMSGGRSNGLQVRSIKRQGSSAPIWNMVSRKENLDSRL